MSLKLNQPTFSNPFSQQFYSLGEEFYSKVSPSPLKDSYWIHFNENLAQQLGINLAKNNRDEIFSILSGQQGIEGQASLAMVYAGHQFGGYSSQLGDGRALLIAQIDSPDGTFDLQLKGAGITPYSRFGDGKAVLRSSIREYLAGEAMHHLGVPSTRALALIGSKEPVRREQIETGAMVARVARTHIRFGHFEFFYYTQQHDALKVLADHVISNFLPEAINASDKYAQLLQYSTDKTAQLIAHWQSIGFAHGVMNTDNMSIIGETLDYGPYGFLDDFDPNFICNHSDVNGRYAFDQQPSIGLWNLNALAHALSPLIDSDSIKAILASYEPSIVKHYSAFMRKKLGFKTENQQDQAICSQLLGLMAEAKTDFTVLFRKLSHFSLEQNNHDLDKFFSKEDATYDKWRRWSSEYKQRLKQENSVDTDRQKQMKAINPKFIPRNYLLQKAIDKAQTTQDHSDIDTLFTLFQTPYDEHAEFEAFAKPPPEWGKHLSISCSS